MDRAAAKSNNRPIANPAFPPELMPPEVGALVDDELAAAAVAAVPDAADSAAIFCEEARVVDAARMGTELAREARDEAGDEMALGRELNTGSELAAAIDVLISDVGVAIEL